MWVRPLFFSRARCGWPDPPGPATRGTGWRDRSARERWWRLGLGLGLANVAGMATGLAVAAVVYRLYYAPWYVAMLLAGPGFLYVLAGARVAVVLATSVRRVAA